MSVYRVLINHIEDFYKLDYLKTDDHILAICADPTRADNLSHLLPSDKIKPLTIVQFVKNILRKQNVENRLYRKSELFMELSVVWKRAGGWENFNSFNQAFNLFTDYRGYTTDIELISEIIDEHPEKLSQGLRWFYAYMAIQEILDEQAAYKFCAEYLNETDDKFGNIIFVGFSHFSAQQIELLTALGKNNDIYLPCFKEMEEELISTDWAYWLDVMGADKVEIGNEKEKSAKLFTYPKGYLAKTISQLVGKECKNGKQVLIFDKNPDFKQILEVDVLHGFFKVATELFDVFFEDLERMSWEDSTINEILSKAISEKEFPKMKFFLSLKETLEQWRSISDENINPNEFEKKIILETLRLNLPRLSYIPLKKDVWKHSIMGLNRIETLDHNKESVICVKNSGLSFSGGRESFSEKVKTFLISLGPLRNYQREKREIQCYVKSILCNEKACFLIEEGTLEENLFWNELNLEEPTKIIVDDKKEKNDYLAKKINRYHEGINRFSASRLQSYIDCPRKYYFTYLDDWSIRNIYKAMLTPSEVGLIVHEVIERKMTMPSLSLDELIVEEMDKYIKNKKLSSLVLENNILKIKRKVKNGLTFLNKLKENDPDILFNFEKHLVGEDASGRIDCYWESNVLGNGLIDFKSSSYGIPTKKDHLEFKKIQLWYYLLNSSNLNNIRFWGFVNLDELESSLFFMTESFPDLNLKGTISETPDLNPFASYIATLKKELLSERNFNANPQSSAVCTYCHLNNICPRGVVDE